MMLVSISFAVGLAAAALLIPLLVRTFIDPPFRLWPTPGPGTWQNRVFWPSFRALNTLAVVTALVEREQLLGLPLGVRVLALVLVVGLALIYGIGMLVLGRSNTYCGQDGLVARGVYRWTRNPQYAAAIPMFASLALAADNTPTYVLCAALIAVYWLMALVEEPWLEAAYGADYRRYCRRVPRFFNWRRGFVLGQAVVRQVQRSAPLRLVGQMLGNTQLLSTGSGRKRF